MKTVTAFGDFSTIGFTMVGLGEPRVVRAGVVGGSFFDVMGLRPVRGRLIDATDDGPNAAGVAVLTHRFWTTGEERHEYQEDGAPGAALSDDHRHPRTVGALSDRNRDHRERRHEPAPPVGNDGDGPRPSDDGAVRPPCARRGSRGCAPSCAVHGAFLTEHPEAYPPKSDYRIDAKLLRDQITSRARTVLLVLLAASALIFVIACSNVANLILARSVRREGELAIRAALGASAGALRRTLLAESLLLCGIGAILGVLVALWIMPILTRYASRFSVRALDLPVDASAAVGGRGPALTAAVLLAFVPACRRPTPPAALDSPAEACGLRRARTAASGCLPSRRSPRRSCCSRAPACC